MRAAFVGSRSLDLKAYAGAILDELAQLPDGTIVLLRRGRKTPAGGFEQLTEQIADRLGFEVEWVEPEPGTGRAGVYERDIALAERADAVVAFFEPDRVMEGGTGHVAEKAIDADRKVDAYIVLDGEKQWVAGHEPEVATVGIP